MAGHACISVTLLRDSRPQAPSRLVETFRCLLIDDYWLIPIVRKYCRHVYGPDASIQHDRA